MRKSVIRQSNIELLRCVLMFMVVVSHFVDHNILEKNTPVELGGDNFIVSHLLNSLCICAVNCFVLISGYFTIKLSLRRILLFLIPIAFYQFLLSVVFYPFNHSISISPFRYWFVSPYVGLMLLSPLLNKGLEQLSWKGLRNIICVLLLLFVLPVISVSGQNGRNLFMFILMYLTGYYIRHYYSKNSQWWRYCLLYMLFATLVFTEAFVLIKMGFNQGYATMSYYYDNILIFFEAVFLFLLFTKFDFVYIISENENMYTGSHSLYAMMGVGSWNHLAIYPFLILGSALLVFICSILVDKVRVTIFSNLEDRIGEWADKLKISFE